MAIKGKKGSRRRPRAVATAPRPYLVPPKTPLFRRKSTQFILLLLLFGVIAVAATAYRISRDNREHLEAVEQFEGQVEGPLLGGVAQPVGGRMLVLPEMGQAIGQLLDGQGNVDEVLKPAKSWERSASEAAETIGAVESDLSELERARDGIEQGLRLYATIAANLQLIPELEGPAQERLLRNVGEELAIAGSVFDRGWSLLLVERHRAGLPDPTLGVPPGFPGGPGGGLPPGLQIPGGG
jgi:hypothetical protein